MTQLEAIRKVCDVCCVAGKEKLEAIRYILDGADPQRTADAIQYLSEGYMELTDIYYWVEEGKKGRCVGI